MDKKIEIQKDKQNSRLPKDRKRYDVDKLGIDLDRDTGIQKDRGHLYC